MTGVLFGLAMVGTFIVAFVALIAAVAGIVMAIPHTPDGCMECAAHVGLSI